MVLGSVALAGIPSRIDAQGLDTTCPLPDAVQSSPATWVAPAQIASGADFSLPIDERSALPQHPDEKPPTPSRTGLKALVVATAADFKAFPSRRSTYVILGIGGAAAALALPFDDELNDQMKDSEAGKFFVAGKVIGYGWVQASAAAGTYVIGRYFINPGDGSTSKIEHVGFDLLQALALTKTLTYGLKQAVRRDRPTGECCSFPSGHASMTFASVSVLERHFGYRAAWPALVIAGYVAASRLFDNRHFLSDVLFGSALGIASGWTVVGRHGRSNFTLMPTAIRGGVAVTVIWAPGAFGD